MDIQELQENIVNAAALMEMFSHPNRLHIMCVLSQGEKSVLALAAEVGLSQPAMSHHLRKLRGEGLVTTRRDAQTIYYSLKGEEASAVLEVLHRLYCSETVQKAAHKSPDTSVSA